MTAIVDYGIGNLFSLKCSFAAVSEEAELVSDPQAILKADRVVLPGVGAFKDAADKLKETGLFDFLKDLPSKGKPLLGICLGMQLLFSRSMEFGVNEGLGLLPGEVRPIEEKLPPDSKLDIPHMGWNGLHFLKESPLFSGIAEGTHVYFVHSYAAFECSDALVACAEYGVPLTAAVQNGMVFGTQFHPEKSGEQGLRILKNFCGLCSS